MNDQDRHNVNNYYERRAAQLYKDTENKKISGVCAGIAEYFSMPVLAVRSIAVLLLIAYTLPMFIAYIIASLVLDEKPKALYKDESDEYFWRSMRRSPQNTFDMTRRKYRDIDRKLQKLEAFVTSSSFTLRREFKDLSD